MHPRQQELTKQASALTEKLAAKQSEKKQSASPVLYMYQDPEGKKFWLEEKRMTVKSPYSGKSFTTKPVKENMGLVNKDVKTDLNPPAGGPGGKVNTKRKKSAGEEWKA